MKSLVDELAVELGFGLAAAFAVAFAFAVAVEFALIEAT